MEFTGERVIPGTGDVDLFNEHRARYLFARRFAAGKTVLDAACGTGYGSALLGEAARRVFGVDISREAVEYARPHYPSSHLHFSQADCLALPFPPGQFDLVVAFEIIEHLEHPEEFLKELNRVLDSKGLLVLSTPNRLYYTDDRQEVNPFHRREFSYAEFEEILKSVFPCKSILFENHIAGLLISGPDAVADLAAPSPGSVVQEGRADGPAKDPRREAHFFVAVCSQHPVEPIQALLYFPSAGNVLREREMHLRLLMEQESQHQQALEESTRWAKELDRQLSEKGEYITELQADYDQKIQWALSLEQELERARSALQKLQQEFEERTAWALRLDAELKEHTERAARLETELKERLEDLHLLYASVWHRIGKKLRLSPFPPSHKAGSGGA
ncbi:MAG: methyltransferase domain-containing protein [Acidobacteria bacterium]|nr:methyltransferase domain-containing protein [Acidobacteriota bacterium]